MRHGIESPPPGAVASAQIGAWATDGGAVLNSPARRLRILVVEDDPVIAMLLGELLTAMGHEVCGIAPDEAGAVASAGVHKPDLMIVDAALGTGSGVRAIDTLVSTGTWPHLFTAGDALAVRRLKPNALVLQKTYNEADLAAAIRRVLQ